MEELTIRLPEDVAALLAMLRDAGYPAYTVGGCVRDALLGIEPHEANSVRKVLLSQRPRLTRYFFFV